MGRWGEPGPLLYRRGRLLDLPWKDITERGRSP